jgi:RimJ/RimL family protein N-acetyltransferase
MVEDTRSMLEPDVGFEALLTDRLTIRRFEATDVPTFAAYRSVPEIARYQSWDAPFSEEQARRFVAAQAASHPDTPDEWFQFAVTETTTGRLVGDVAAASESDHRLARIGFTLAPEAQGKGFATEAVTALLGYLFSTRGKHRVAAACDVRNLASIALLERVGMRREAYHLQSVWWKGEWTDEYVYAILADEWPAPRSAPGW